MRSGSVCDPLSFYWWLKPYLFADWSPWTSSSWNGCTRKSMSSRWSPKQTLSPRRNANSSRSRSVVSTAAGGAISGGALFLLSLRRSSAWLQWCLWKINKKYRTGSLVVRRFAEDAKWKFVAFVCVFVLEVLLMLQSFCKRLVDKTAR